MISHPNADYPSQGFQTHAIRQPNATHFRKATCEEFLCGQFMNGWSLKKSELSDQDLAMIKSSGRRYREEAFSADEIYLIFEAGQPCFAAHTHRVSLDREAFFFVAQGDSRTLNLRHHTTKRFNRAEDFRDHMAENLDRLHTIRERG